MLTKTTPQTITDLICLSEAVLDTPKKQIVLTCLQEGPGNLTDRRWYSKACVEGLESKVYSRRKVFIGHLQEGQSSGDDLKNWSCNILKTWVVEQDGRLHRKVRLQIFDDWLWIRCERAPGEMALSIEGRGAGGPGVIEGENWTIIEDIPYLNAFKLVPYPGNAKMGADLVEGASDTQEDSPMDWTKVSLDELKKHRPDLYEISVKEGRAEGEATAKAADQKVKEAEQKAELVEKAKSGDAKALTDSFRKELDDRLAENGKVIQKLVEEKDELAKRLDEKDVRERLSAKERLVDRMLSESQLPAEAKTPRFRETLMRLTEKKEGDKTITIEEQIKAEIDERAKLCVGGEAHVKESGGGTAGSSKIDPEKLNEEEGEVWHKAVFDGEDGDQAVIEYRKKLAEDSKKEKEAAAK